MQTGYITTNKAANVHTSDGTTPEQEGKNMTQEQFNEWYAAHTSMQYARYDTSAMGYKMAYSNGDTYEARYTLKPGYVRGSFEPMASDYNFEMLINGVVSKRNDAWIS